VFVSDCEGPISKNDNAFELASHFVPEGEKLFIMLSKYDDILADIAKRPNYKAGNTLKLILPFLKAYGVTNLKMYEFSLRTLALMPNAKDMLTFTEKTMESFIVSTSYEHYIRALCRKLKFPFENTYCTRVNLDKYSLTQQEIEKMKRLSKEIVAFPLIKIQENAKNLNDLSPEDQETIRTLDKIFWSDLTQSEAGKMLMEVNPVGGSEKAEALKDLVRKTGSTLSHVIYIGDSITDVECFRLVKKNNGLAVSFNGNAYAIREAEVAVMSENAIVTAILADVFNHQGKKAVYEMIKEWSIMALKKYDVNQDLQKKAMKIFLKNPPKIEIITSKNKERLIRESSIYRKRVRGETIGNLG
jgi:energy-converting hydrogenase A subunit R